MAIELGQSTNKPSAGNQDHVPWYSRSLGRKKVSSQDRMFFTERLALLLETGNALHTSLTELGKQTSNPALAELVNSMAQDVMEGRQFSDALAKHPEMFSLTYVSLVAAGEKGGFMDRVLVQLQEMEEKKEKLRSNLISSLSYPAFLIVFSVGVVIFILTVVFPKFGTLFGTIHDQLPTTTLFLMALSNLLLHYWPAILTATFLGAGVLARWLSSASGIHIMARLKLTIPYLKDIFIQYYLIHFLRTLGLSLDNGVSAVDALVSCRDIVNNVVFRQLIARIERHVAEGRGFSYGFEESGIVPNMVQQMIRTGEASSNLAKVMNRVADFYERELDRRIALISRIVEPVMLLVMGVAVGLIVSSLILPIFKLSRAVH